MTEGIRVTSVPASHPYVRGVLRADDVTVLDDPAPEGAGPGQWWPPVVLSPGWAREHADDAEILHIHFGTESFEPDALGRAIDDAHAIGWPVVETVHDLDHPQLVDQALYHRQLDVMVPKVDAVVTLTAGAAREIRARWNRTATVLPHPRLLADGLEPGPGETHQVPVVGMHLKDLRPNVDGVAAVTELLAALTLVAEHGRPVAGEVHLNRSVRDDAQRETIRALCDGRRDLLVVEHDRLDDQALADALAALDVCVLPYSHGTHSGWLELCWDLGVPVAVPDVGYFAEQHDGPSVAEFSWGAGGATLASCIERLVAASPPAGSAARQRLSHERLIERSTVDARTARAHVDLYRALIDARRAR